MILSDSKTSTIGYKRNCLLVLVFLYFVTLSGDLLQLTMGAVEFKVSRFFACALFCVLLLSNRLRLIEKKFFLCFLLLVSSCILSSFFSSNISRTIAGIGAAIFTYLCFFLVPLNLMFLFDRDKILRLYFLSFVCVGVHASLQFALSFFGIQDPFVTQCTGISSIARGQSCCFEPSFYALYATPFVAFFNAHFLFSKKEDRSSWISVLGINLFLLVSTSTGGFFSYLIFIAVCLMLTLFSFIRRHFPFLLRKICKFTLVFGISFCSVGLILQEMFLRTFYKFFHVGLFAHWSFMERWEKIVAAWDVFLEFPLFGAGLRSVEHYLYLKSHFDNAQTHLYGKLDNKEMFDGYINSNVFIEILSSLGVYGLGVFCLFGILIWHMFTTALKSSRISFQERTTILSLFLSVIVMMICLQFNQEIFRSYVWVHVGLSLGYVLQVDSKNLLYN